MAVLTRRQLVLLLGVALIVLTLVVGVYGLVSGPDSDHDYSQASHGTDESRPVIAASPESLTRTAPVDPSSRRLPRTNDPIVFARSVATALFDWDTTSGFLPTDYQAPVLAEADPSGEETPGLISDIATYMPTLDQWLNLATMDVTQTLSIASAQVPTTWTSAVAQAHGELRPGTTAVTIIGTRHRAGVWDGEHSATSSPVSFTVFVACQPAFDRCHVLRLSQLDNPLK